MILAKLNADPLNILENLSSLFIILTELRQKFEIFSNHIADKPIHEAVSELADTCSQYEHVVRDRIEMTSNPLLYNAEPGNAENFSLLSAKHQLLRWCSIGEQQIISAYRQLLNEPFLDKNLRLVLRDQLQTLSCSFMKIKLLNTTLRFRKAA